MRVFVVNLKNEVLLQRRAPDKDSYPGFWDISVGGHVVAGEDPLTAAVNEVSEEIGLQIDPDNLQLILTHKSSDRPQSDFINNTFYHVYLLRADKTLSDLTPQASEVSELKFVPVAEFREMVKRSEPNLVPHPVDYAKFFEIVGD